MKLQTIEIEGKVYAETEDGKPVLTMDDGKRVPFDVPHSYATISRLNNELKAARETRESVEAKLKVFDGIEDPDAARSALETVRNFKDGDLVKAGEVEAVRVAARKAAEEQVANEAKRSGLKIKDLEKERDQFRGLYTSEKIGRVFSGSKFISDKCLVPAPMMQAQFGSHFRVENGKVVAYDGDERITSVARPGDVAEPDEALEILVNAYPFRDSILKGTGSSGGGSRGAGNQHGGAGRTMTMAAFNAMTPGQQAQIMTSKDRPTLVE